MLTYVFKLAYYARQFYVYKKIIEMQSLKVRVTGIEPLLLNNPQSVDPFNKYAREAKKITSQRKKTDEDLLNLRRIEMKSKLYWDGAEKKEDEEEWKEKNPDKKPLGVYVPSSWITAAIASQSWNKAKIKKAEIRSGVFVMQPKIKLKYNSMKSVEFPVDIVSNESFKHAMNLKQGQVRITKVAPIFHNWSFEFDLDFDDEIINKSELKHLIETAAKYGGFGDFRPTFGRADVLFDKAIKKHDEDTNKAKQEAEKNK